MSKPVEALLLTTLTMQTPPSFLTTQDWYSTQGVMAGTALAAIVGAGDIKQRVIRAVVSIILGFMAGQYTAELLGQDSLAGFRFVSGAIAFGAWWIVLAIEKYAKSWTGKAVKAVGDAVIERFAGVGMGAGTTDRADAFYRAVEEDKGLAGKSDDKARDEN